MKICGFEKFSMVDYPRKIACTVFTAGCNFRCPFCHNAPLVTAPQTRPGVEREAEEYLLKRRGLVDAVCISGGEPTLQADLKDFAKFAKSLGYLVKLDTNGTRPDVLETLISDKLVDYVAMDIKNSRARYNETSGICSCDFEAVLRSIRLLLKGIVDYEFRTTLIDELHGEAEMQDIAQLIGGAENYYLQKYIDNENCIEHGFTEVGKSRAEEFLKIVKKHVKHAELRGY